MINQKQVRNLLSKTKNKLITISAISRLFKLDVKQATEMLVSLEAQGFIEQSGVEKCWVMSIRGKLLVYQRQERIFKLSTLQQHLKDLLERAAYVNNSNQFPDRITSIKTTSEYPITQPGQGIHIAYSLDRKVTGKEYRDIANKLLKQNKKVIGNITERFAYPQEAIRIFLKSRSQVLKLTKYTHAEVHQLDGTVLLDEQPEEHASLH